ncbi:inorganic phosphate transporter [Candidatus Aerophobetes bacterium]|nr:inorganic phosphate transporter [Candidatus Aerophobetes bacterium]
MTLQIFTQLRVPVSNSQAIVGAVVRMALISGTKAINKKMFTSAFADWIVTPFMAGVISFSLCHL